MMFRQRPPAPESDFRPRRLWRPAGLPLTPRSSDRYVVVDERVDGVLTLAIDDWPRVDGGGRLVFAGATRRLAVQEAALLEAATRARRSLGQDAPDRPVRIGDAFLVRGESGEDPARWPRLCDVTLPAREAAKAAFYGAVAPTLPPDAGPEQQPRTFTPPARGPAAPPSV